MSFETQIPSEWEIFTLGDVLIRSDQRIDPTTSSSKNFFYVGLEDIESNTGKLLKTVTTSGKNIKSIKSSFHTGDILYGKLRPNLNKVYLAEQNGICSTDFWVFKTSAIVDAEYMTYYLRSPWVVEQVSQLATGANLPRVSETAFDAIKIPLPSLAEQQRIVAILRQADKLRRLRQEVNDKSGKLILSLFYDIFGTPNEWQKVIPLAKLVDFVGGGTPSRKVEKYFTGDIPWATSKDIKKHYLDDAEEHITQEAIQESATNLVPAGTILLVVKSKILMHSLPISITKRPFCFGQDLKGLVPKPEIEPIFIFAALLAQKVNILKSARGVNTEGLTLDVLREISIPQAETLQQKEFVKRVQMYNELENALATSIQSFDRLYQSLLTQAFTGRLTKTWREKQIGQNIQTNLMEAVGQEYVESFSIFIQEPSEQYRLDLTTRLLAIAQRFGIKPELSSDQVLLLQTISSIQGYITIDGVKKKSGLSLTIVRQGLQLFAEIGLIKAVHLPDRPTKDVVVYVPSFRLLREEDRAKEGDLRTLLKDSVS